MTGRRRTSRTTLGSALIASVAVLWISLGFVASWHAQTHDNPTSGDAACTHVCRHSSPAPDEKPPPGRRDDCGTCVQLMVARPKALQQPPGTVPWVALVVAWTPEIGDESIRHPGVPFVRTSRGPPSA
jgi:hypothetical protein